MPKSDNTQEGSSSNRGLKIWNGRSHGGKYRNHCVYVAATSMKQAAELVSKACYGVEFTDRISPSEISKYFSKGSWGNRMNGIKPDEPCVYLCDESNSTNVPFRVI